MVRRPFTAIEQREPNRGMAHPSVRDENGQCYATFLPLACDDAQKVIDRITRHNSVYVLPLTLTLPRYFWGQLWALCDTRLLPRPAHAIASNCCTFNWTSQHRIPISRAFIDSSGKSAF